MNNSKSFFRMAVRLVSRYLQKNGQNDWFQRIENTFIITESILRNNKVNFRN